MPPLSALPLALALAAGPEIKTRVGTFRYDPVELVRTGKSVVGAYSIWHDHYAYRYLFANEENRREFLARPELYQIQLGGGCAKMGSLSGRGSPDRFALYEKKIYVFASESCRSTFLNRPAKYVEADDPAPIGTAEEAKRGRVLIDRVVAWAGGAKTWRALPTLWQEIRETVKSGNTTYDHRTETAIAWPNRVLRTDRWNASAYADLIDGKAGHFIGASEITPMDPQQVRALQRIRNHAFPSVMKAAAGPGFLAYARDDRAEGVVRVDVYFDRTWVGLDIVKASGEVRAMEFNGRRQEHGIDRREFSAFASVEGLRLPSAWTTYFEGKLENKRAVGDVAYRRSLVGVSFELPSSVANR